MTRATIAHVLSSFGLGGQERLAVDLARLQRSLGHPVLAISLAPTDVEAPSAALFREADVRTESVPKHWRLDPTLPVRLAALLRRAEVKIVHTHNPHALIYGAPAARLAAAAVVHTKHGVNPDRARRLWLRRLAARLVDAYVAVTPTLAKVALARKECDPARLHVVSNGVDVARFAPSGAARRALRLELGIPEEAWVVGTVGRLSPEKDQALLIDAMVPLLDEHRRLVIVGHGPEDAALRTRIAATGRGQFVHMTGSRNDVESLLTAFDVFALTSRTEGLPLVLLEAMATGLPVVATAVGGVPDVVEHRVTGLLLASGDAPRLTRQLGWLSTDASLGRQIGRAARRDVLRRHSLERVVQDYGVLYESLVGSDGARMRIPAGPF